jgi:tripartite-type tricarboxylate transporter receptor subunit TctC
MTSLFKQLATVAALVTLCAAAHAQVDKPVRILVGFPPGGSADQAARLVGERMATELKQPVVVENKPGAGGRIAAELLKNAPPDGSTLLVTPVVVPVLAPLVFSKLQYNPQTDFAPVAPIANFQFGLSVNAKHPAKTVPEVLRWMQANPGTGQLWQPCTRQPASLLRRDAVKGRRR